MVTITSRFLVCNGGSPMSPVLADLAMEVILRKDRYHHCSSISKMVVSLC